MSDVSVQQTENKQDQPTTRRIQIQLTEDALYRLKGALNKSCAKLRLNYGIVQTGYSVKYRRWGIWLGMEDILDICVEIAGDTQAVDTLCDGLIIPLVGDIEMTKLDVLWDSFDHTQTVRTRIADGVYPYEIGTQVRLMPTYIEYVDRKSVAMWGSLDHPNAKPGQELARLLMHKSLVIEDYPDSSAKQKLVTVSYEIERFGWKRTADVSWELLEPIVPDEEQYN